MPLHCQPPLTLIISTLFSDKIAMNVGLRYKILSNYFPLLYTNIQFNFTSNFITQGNIVYGGYGKLNVGITVAKQFKEKYQIIMGSNHVGAYLLPSNTFSNNGF